MIEDRDRALYGFHGRADIIRDISGTLKVAESRNSGGIRLIQGPPGVGKTALLIELSRIAHEECGWKVIDINPTTLKDASELAAAAGVSAAVSETRTGKGGATFALGVSGSGVKAGGEVAHSSTYAGAKPTEVLKQMAQQDRGTLLVMDEAQRINRLLGMDTQQRSDAEDALFCIHGGRCGGPLLLLAGGLGHTEDQFRKVGISRLHGGAVTNLDRVSDTAARKIIKGWLTKGARVGLKAPGYTELVEEVVNRSYGWPHHLASYGASAQKVIWHGRHLGLPPDVRDRILDMGDKLRTEYYRKRAARLELWECAVLGHLVTNSGDKNKWDSLILKQIDNALQERNDNPLPLRERALASGVLAEVPNEKVYHIPIPSMADWLVSESHRYTKISPRISREVAGIVRKELGEVIGLPEGSHPPPSQGLDTGLGSREQDSGITK